MPAYTPDVEARIDPLRALAALGFQDVSPPVRVKGGWDTLLWRFAAPDGRLHTLRVHWLPDREEFAWRERVALRACQRADLPAPRLEAEGRVDGLPAMVLTWRPGRPLLSFVEKKPWALWRLGKLFGRTQARMHAVEPPEEFVARAPDDWLSRVTEQYADLRDHAATMGMATTSLIHVDFHPLNVVSDGKAVTGILDWARSGAGDPRADLARTEITLLAAPAPPGALRPFLDLFRSLLLRAWRAGYEELAGPAPDFRPLRAWAGATLIAEVEMVVGRAGVWGSDSDLDRLRRMVESWARQDGVRPGLT